MEINNSSQMCVTLSQGGGRTDGVELAHPSRSAHVRVDTALTRDIFDRPGIYQTSNIGMSSCPRYSAGRMSSGAAYKASLVRER